jgi:hypothetical protein
VIATSFGGVIMLVKCSTSFRHQTTEGEIYLVIEVIIISTRNEVSYRVIDNEGCPAIYESNDFEMVSGNLDGYCLMGKNNSKIMIITPKLIFDSKLNMEHIDGFWGVYFDSTSNEGKCLLENVIKDLSFREKIPAPSLSWD